MHARRVFHAAPRARRSRSEARRQAKGLLARPARAAAITATPRTAILQPAAGDCFCSHASPSAAVPHEAARRYALASEDGGSLTERILFLADGSSQLQRSSHLSAAVPSVRKRSTVAARHDDFSQRNASTSGAAVRIMDANSAATGDMLSMATLRPRNETEQETFYVEQNGGL